MISLCFVIILSPCGQPLPAAPIPYSGKVAINGANFQGDAQFTFALRDANGIVHWKNGADANTSVVLNVDRGLYITLLGGNTMNDFPPNLFLQNSELFLQVRFYRPDSQEWLHMLPDQRITSAPHALAADVLADLNASVVLPEQNAAIQTGSITRSMLAPGVLSDLNASNADGDKSEATRGGYDYWAVKINASGTKVWDKRFGGSEIDQCLGVIPTTGGGYLLAGYSNSPADGDKSEATRGSDDMWAVKIADDGNK